MKVFVTGGTGALGRLTIPRLRTAGHDVRAVARSEDKAVWLRDQGVEPVVVDLFDAPAVMDAVRGTDAVAHLATHVPPLLKAGRPKSWALHNRLRAEATPILMDAARATGATTFVKESVCFFYEDGGDAVLDEDAPLIESRFSAPSLSGERAAAVFDGDGRRAVVMRFGFFYGPWTRGTDEALRLARFGLSPLAGRPDGYQPMVHVDDAAAAVVAAIDGDASGAFNVADDPTTKRANLEAFASAFALRRPPRTIPSWILRLSAGSGADVLSGSRRVSSTRFRDATGWEPEYPSVIEGWPAVARAREAA